MFFLHLLLFHFSVATAAEILHSLIWMDSSHTTPSSLELILEPFLKKRMHQFEQASLVTYPTGFKQTYTFLSIQST